MSPQPPFRPNDPPTPFRPNDPPRTPPLDVPAVDREEVVDILRRAAEEKRRIKIAEGYKRVGRIRELKREIKEDLYEMVSLLRDFQDDDSWGLLDLKGEDGEAVRYKSFKEFVEKESGISYSLAMELIAVVRSFPASMARELGMNKLYGVVMITRATGCLIRIVRIAIRN